MHIGLAHCALLSATKPKFEASVRRRVHQGISLVGILCAFRLGTKELWLAHLDLAEHDNALRDELLFVISPYRLEYSDFMAQFIGRVFLDEQFQQTSWRAEVRRQLCDLIFNGTNDDQDFCRIGRSLGFDSTVPRIALAIDYELSDVSRMNPEGALGNLVDDIACQIKIPADHEEVGRGPGRWSRVRESGGEGVGDIGGGSDDSAQLWVAGRWSKEVAPVFGYCH